MTVFCPLLLSACGQAADIEGSVKQEAAKETAAEPVSSETEIPELTFYDMGSGDSNFDDRIAVEIMRRTGVKITLEKPAADIGEQVNLMLAYENYPDVILIGAGDIGKYEAAGVLVPLSDHLDQLPNVVDMYDVYLNHMYYNDGKLYYLGNWYGKEENAVSAFMLRYDYLCEIVGRERADSDEPFTRAEFEEILHRFSELHPEINGTPSLPMTICTDYGYRAAFQGMYGIKTYYEGEDHALFLQVKNPNYEQMFHFMNSLYRNKLLDKEWIVNRRQLFEEKLLSGRVFATACTYWDLDDINEELQEAYGEDAAFYSYKVLGEGITKEETTYSGRSTLGWDAIAITNHCKDVDAALRVLDFLASEEGQYLMMWGIEGEDWTYVNGVHTPTPDTVEMAKAGLSTLWRNHLRQWTWLINNGKGFDGTYFDLMNMFPNKTMEIARRRVASPNDLWDTSYYDALTPVSGTSEALIWKNVSDIIEAAYLDMINAESEEALEILYDNLLSNVEAAGLSQAEAVITENYRQRLILWKED